MKKQPTEQSQPHASRMPMKPNGKAAGTLTDAGDQKIAGEDLARYSHKMLLSLQRLALKQDQQALAYLLGIAALEAKNLMKVKLTA